MVVQAGADAHFSDPLADLMLTTKDYQKVFSKIIQFANKYSKEKVLFTLGGGYTITAAFRIWSILYMMLLGFEIPDELPAKWLLKWENKIKNKIPPKLHDKNPSYEIIPRKEEITKHNRDLARRLLDAVSPDWL